MDIHWRDSVQCPSEEQYREMVKRSWSAGLWRKDDTRLTLLHIFVACFCVTETGGLFKLAVRLMTVYSSSDK